MSHYAVLITGTNENNNSVEEQLAPFDENRRMPMHIRYTKAELIAQGRETFIRAEEYYKKWKADPKAYEDGCHNPTHMKWLKEEVPTMIKQLEANDVDAFYEEGTSWYEPEDLDKDGNYITQYNDDAKWDWYQVGGRFEGSFINKAGESVDSVLVGDIDWDARRVEIKKNRAKRYAEEQKKPAKDRWIFQQNRDELLLMSKQQYVDQPIEDFCTFAVLHKGVWYERGKMGWWAMVSDEKEEGVWEKEFKKLLESLNPETELTLVDCHI